MIRIVHVTGSAAWAGGERQLMDLLTHLDAAKFKCAVICPEAGPLIERLQVQSIPVRVVRLEPLINPLAASRLASVIREFSPAIVQSHGARSNFYARWACRRLGVLHISTIHNSLRDYPVPAAKKLLYQWVDRFTSNWSERIVCVSDSLRQDLISSGVAAEKLSVIYNGVDLEAFDPGRARGDLRKQWGERDFLIGLIGRMTEQKGHRFLLDALPAVAEKFPNAKAVFVGDGPLRQELERRTHETGLGGRVVFAGVRQDMANVFAALDAVVLPSLSEGMPYVMLEALAMEKPVVASAVNGVGEVAADGREARLVPPRDPQRLAAAIIATAGDMSCAQRMAKEGRKKVLKEFSVDVMVRNWSRLYEGLT